LTTHYPAHFLAGILTHDPGMYPRRLLLEDAREHGIPILPLDVNLSEPEYVVEVVGGGEDVVGRAEVGAPPRAAPAPARGEGVGPGVVERSRSQRTSTSTDLVRRRRRAARAEAPTPARATGGEPPR